MFRIETDSAYWFWSLGLLLCYGYSNLTILIEVWVKYIIDDLMMICVEAVGSSMKIDETWSVVILKEVEASFQYKLVF